MLRAVTAVLAAVLALPVILPQAPAAADETKYLAFYTPPDPLPAGKPGDLVRSEPMNLVYEPSGQLGSWVATGTRIMYRTTNAKASPSSRPASTSNRTTHGRARGRGR